MSKTRKRDNHPRATVEELAARFGKHRQQAAVRQWDGVTLIVEIDGQIYRCKNLEAIPDPPAKPTKSTAPEPAPREQAEIMECGGPFDPYFD